MDCPVFESSGSHVKEMSRKMSQAIRRTINRQMRSTIAKMLSAQITMNTRNIRSARAELPRDIRNLRTSETSFGGASAGRSVTELLVWQELEVERRVSLALGVSPSVGYRAKMNRRLQRC